MSYILEFRDEHDRHDMVEKLKKAKKAICEAWEAVENSAYNERRYPYMHHRDRDEVDEMEYRRDSRGRYTY